MKHLLLIVSFLISGQIYAQNEVEIKVGDQAIDFSIQSIGGDEINLKNLYEENLVVLVVLRGWPGYQCPVCSRQVGSLLADESKLENLEATVLMVYPGPSDELQKHAKEFSEDFNFPTTFYFALDPDYSMINKYGLRWKAPKETAYPSTFVIDRKGKIIFSKISKTHGGRASVDEIIEILEKK